MNRTSLISLAIYCGLMVSAYRATADIVVTLDPAGDTATVGIGARVVVDILLSVDGDDAPMLMDIRQVAFDTSETDDGIALDDTSATFDWDLELEGDVGLYIIFDTVARPSATYAGQTPVEGFILVLTETPRRVGSMEFTVDASGTLDLISGTGAVFNVGFEQPRDYSAAIGNLSGGRLTFTAQQTSGANMDGDGLPDAVDDFPNDPDETTDTDNDNIGNVADTDDDGDGVSDDEDAFPLQPAQQGNDNATGNLNANANQNVNDNRADNANRNDNQSGGNDNDSNMGPRATGGICGFGLLGVMVFMMSALLLTRVVQHRNRE